MRRVSLDCKQSVCLKAAMNLFFSSLLAVKTSARKLNAHQSRRAAKRRQTNVLALCDNVIITVEVLVLFLRHCLAQTAA